MSSSKGPVEEAVSPPGLAAALVRAAMPDRVKEEAVAAFGEEFSEKVANSGKVKANIWAHCVAWDVLYRRYETFFQLLMLIIAIIALGATIL